MKIKMFNFNETSLRKKLEPVSHIDFSLFIDSPVENSSELSKYNIMVLQEPNEYFGLHDWTIFNQQYFSFILSWDSMVLNRCPNSEFFGVGTTWMYPEQYNDSHEKKFEVAHLAGKLLKTCGHLVRHELLARRDEITNDIALKFFHTYGDRHNIEQARKDKEEVFGYSQYGVAIENVNRNGWFTEKIIDCFLLKTIPIYWGCPNIGEYFDIGGILQVQNCDNIIDTINTLTPSTYTACSDSIEKNYSIAKTYVDYEQRIADRILQIFKYNGIL